MPLKGNDAMAEAGWRCLAATGLAGRKISPHPFAEQEAVRNKKNPDWQRGPKT
jgi:hypothetical protein